MANLSLLGSTSRVETPFIKVTIGEYTFGVFEKKVGKLTQDSYSIFRLNKIKYPNYIQSLNIQKINGTVNKYTLQISYPITEQDDPNFFEKVFSSVSQTRKIVFSYGDMSIPTFLFKNEEAIILDVKKRFNIATSVINYTVKAVSTGTLSNMGAYKFPATYDQPSNVIKKLLYNYKKLGLLEIFPGMRERGIVEREGLIPGNDKKVNIEAQTNISALDYLLYLVEMMVSSKKKTNTGFYTLTVLDDTSGVFPGTYFKIVEVEGAVDINTAYDIDVGYLTKDVITGLEIEDDETYAIYYNFSQKLNDAEYVQRINDRGEIEEKYATILNSGTAEGLTTSDVKNWWTRVTEFPIKATITFKGLLRPAMLMSHVRLNIYFYGRKFVDSGLYVVTKEVDEVGINGGFRTTLSLLRIGKSDLSHLDIQ